MLSSEEPAHLVSQPGYEFIGVGILPQRPDEAAYTGILTFTATKPVEVGIGHRLHIDNSTLSQIDEKKFGDYLVANIFKANNTQLLVSYLHQALLYPTMELHHHISLDLFLSLVIQYGSGRHMESLSLWFMKLLLK
jgi:hypothetical protein